MMDYLSSFLFLERVIPASPTAITMLKAPAVSVEPHPPPFLFASGSVSDSVGVWGAVSGSVVSGSTGSVVSGSTDSVVSGSTGSVVSGSTGSVVSGSTGSVV